MDTTPPPSRKNPIDFGDFSFDPATLELTRRGRLVPLQTQPARVLATLLARPGELVTRDELFRAVWGDGTIVDFEPGLNYCVRQVRQALGDPADAPRFIETLRGRGYRFAGGKTNQAAPPEPPRQAGEVVAAAARRSSFRRAGAAVLLVAIGAIGVPAGLRLLAPAPAPAIGVAAFAAPADSASAWPKALHTQIVARLARSTPITVVDREAARSGTATTWELRGSIESAGDRVRVTAVLEDQRDGSVVWSEVFERGAADALGTQALVAERIAFSIRATIEGPGAIRPGPRLERRPRSSAPD